MLSFYYSPSRGAASTHLQLHFSAYFATNSKAKCHSIHEQMALSLSFFILSLSHTRDIHKTFISHTRVYMKQILQIRDYIEKIIQYIPSSLGVCTCARMYLLGINSTTHSHVVQFGIYIQSDLYKIKQVYVYIM